MTSDTHFFTVWTNGSAVSIFGAASHPVIRNGEYLCFETEERARAIWWCRHVGLNYGPRHYQ
jgi:hypothetical protein